MLFGIVKHLLTGYPQEIAGLLPPSIPTIAFGFASGNS